MAAIHSADRWCFVQFVQCESPIMDIGVGDPGDGWVVLLVGDLTHHGSVIRDIYTNFEVMILAMGGSTLRLACPVVG